MAGYDYMHELDELVKTMKRTHSHFIESITTSPSSACGDTLGESSDSKAVKSSKSESAADENVAAALSDVAAAEEEQEEPREKDEIERQAEQQAEQYLKKYIQYYGNPFAHPAARWAASPNYAHDMQRIQQHRNQVQQQHFQQRRFQFQQQQSFPPQQQFYPQPLMSQGHITHYWPYPYRPNAKYQVPLRTVNPPQVNLGELGCRGGESGMVMGAYQNGVCDAREREQAVCTEEGDGEEGEEIDDGSLTYQASEECDLTGGDETANFDFEEECEKPSPKKTLCDACGAALKRPAESEGSPAEASGIQPEETHKPAERYTSQTIPPTQPHAPPKVLSICINDVHNASYYADTLSHVIRALPYLNLNGAHSNWTPQVNYQIQAFY